MVEKKTTTIQTVVNKKDLKIVKNFLSKKHDGLRPTNAKCMDWLTTFAAKNIKDGTFE